MRGRHFLVGLAFVCMMVALVGFGAGATTYGLFSDSVAGGGTIQAAESFDDDPGKVGPPGNRGFDDQNGNGQWDEGEPTVNQNDLSDFDDEGTNLVIPRDFDEINPKGNNDLSVRAASITAATEFNAGNSGVTLNAVDGGISITGEAIRSETKDVSLDATGDIDLRETSVTADNRDITIETDGVLDISDATIDTTGNGKIELRASQIVADSASVSPQNGGTIISATQNGGGSLDVSGATVSGGNDGVTLESRGTMRLNESVLTSENGAATADLGSTGSTLYVANVAIDDSDGVLVYEPPGVSVVPERDDVESTE